MKRTIVLTALAAALAGVCVLPIRAQTTGKFLAPRNQVVAVKAARMFDSRSGTLLNNQTVVIRGEIGRAHV